jgi:hypothetical protein
MHGTNYARKNDGYIDWRTGTAWDSSRRKSEKDVVTVVDDDDGSECDEQKCEIDASAEGDFSARFLERDVDERERFRR